MRFCYSRIFLLVLASLSPAIAQSISAGIKAGVRFDDEFSDTNGTLHDESKRYTLGPMVDFRLPLRFSLEFDALYQPVGYTVQNFDFDFVTSRERSSSWEFPIVAKYRLPGFARVGPYAGIGYAPHLVTGSRVDGQIDYDLQGHIIAVSSTKLDTAYDTTHGLVIEGGLRIPVPHFHISPEIRYTRWNNRFLDHQGLHGFGYFSQQDQVEILFGLTWH
jgi:outer membrane protein with beta-barrel domain